LSKEKIYETFMIWQTQKAMKIWCKGREVLKKEDEKTNTKTSHRI